MLQRTYLEEISSAHSPESLIERLRGEAGVVLLRSALFESAQARYSFVAARPFLTVRSFGSRCELAHGGEAPRVLSLDDYFVTVLIVAPTIVAIW